MAKDKSTIIVVGINHRSAPVEVREKLAFNGNLDSVLHQLLETAEIKEGVLLSTCNRVEVIACTTDPQAAAKQIPEFLATEREVLRSSFEEHLYTHMDKAAVGHLFRVAASLDSMVVGEPQILGQLKDSYAISSAAGTVGTVLHRCFHKSFSVAKRVRTETQVAAKAVSVSSAAVDLARKIFDHLEDKTAMLIGAGEMSELAARHLQGHGIGSLIITNRTFETRYRAGP